jgi:WD40 repeat protein
MMVLMRMPLAFADQPFTKPISTIPLLPSNIPNETADHYPQGYAMGYTFSQDGRLFASFFAGKRRDDDHTNSNIRIWDTQTGKLKYQTKIPHYYNSYRGDRYDIKFSPDNKMLYLASATESQVFIWQFTQRNTIEVICTQGDRAEFYNVIQVAPNNKRLLLQGFSYTQLCTKETLVNGKTRYSSGFFHNEKATAVLHENKLLVIYNKKTFSETTIALNAGELKELVKRKLVDISNITPESDAAPVTDIIDPANQLLIVVEVLDDDLLLHQWNYAKRKWLGTQTFTGLAKPDMEVKLYKNYLLIYSPKKDLAILQKNGLQFSLLWQKQYNSLKNLIDLDFSLDGKYIISDFDMIETETGRFLPHSPVQKTPNKSDYTAYIEPIIKDEFFINYGRKDLKCQANINLKSDVYSLLNQQVVKEVDGLILDISPDGKMLVACKGSELFLMPI